MSTAKKFSSVSAFVNQSPDVMADIFIDEMAAETGCSHRFLDSARVSVYKLFRDVEGDTLEACLDDIKNLIIQQAETENYCQRAVKAADKLAQSHMKIGKELLSASVKMQEAKRELNTAVYSLYGLSGKTVHTA